MVGRGSQYSCQRFLAALKQAYPHWKDMSHARTCFTENLPPCLNFRLQRQGLRRHPWESQPLRQTRQDCLSCIAGITGFSYTRRWALHHFSHCTLWRACEHRLCGCLPCRNDARLAAACIRTAYQTPGQIPGL
jgi:hypothetical protein